MINEIVLKHCCDIVPGPMGKFVMLYADMWPFNSSKNKIFHTFFKKCFIHSIKSFWRFSGISKSSKHKDLKKHLK